jgi:hypothetical protein
VRLGRHAAILPVANHPSRGDGGEPADERYAAVDS